MPLYNVNHQEFLHKEIEAASAGINFPGQLRRWVRPAGPCRECAAAQVERKPHLDETWEEEKYWDVQDESMGWSGMEARMLPGMQARATRMIIVPAHMSSQDALERS